MQSSADSSAVFLKYRQGSQLARKVSLLLQRVTHHRNPVGQTCGARWVRAGAGGLWGGTGKGSGGKNPPESYIPFPARANWGVGTAAQGSSLALGRS